MKALLFLFPLFIASSLQGTYNPSLSRQLWRASSIAYLEQDKVNLKQMDCGDACDELRGYKFFAQFSPKAPKLETLSYSIFENPEAKRVIFAFRGSDGMAQVIKEAFNSDGKAYDLHNIPRAIAIHYFIARYKDYLRINVLTQAKSLKAQCPDCTFYFTGHSLGGALTSHAALDISLSKIIDKSQIQIYTYGSPRMGDVHLAEAITRNVAENFRVVHNRDRVTHIPPCTGDGKGGCDPMRSQVNRQGKPAFSTYHTGTEIFYDDPDSPTSYRVCMKPEDPTCSKKYGLFSLRKADHFTYLGLSSTLEVKAHPTLRPIKLPIPVPGKPQASPVKPPVPQIKPPTPSPLRPPGKPHPTPKQK